NLEYPLSQLLNKLIQNDDSWVVSQQIAAQNKFAKLINKPSALLLDPKVQYTRGQPVGSQNKKAKTFTKRDLLTFELEEIRINSRK
ncbi:9787_t:CDS:1, partial [Racocetra persica]